MPAARPRSSSRLRALNPHAPILCADRGRVDPAAIVDTHGFDLSRAAADLEAEEDHHHHDHISDDGISSLLLVAPGDLDGDAVEAWIDGVLTTRGVNILRMKGILAIAGESRRVVVQAVNMLYEGDHGRDWGSDPRTTRLVFIGRNLDEAALRQGFAACRMTEPV